jgi:phosphoribosylformimino-5-aminoimidazole carboxamide ribotide isomerase
MLNGPSLDLYRDLIQQVRSRAFESGREIPFKLIASGGIHHMNDFSLLKELGCEAVVVGKALLEGKLEVRKLATISD